MLFEKSRLKKFLLLRILRMMKNKFNYTRSQAVNELLRLVVVDNFFFLDAHNKAMQMNVTQLLHRQFAHFCILNKPFLLEYFY